MTADVFTVRVPIAELLNRGSAIFWFLGLSWLIRYKPSDAER